MATPVSINPKTSSEAKTTYEGTQDQRFTSGQSGGNRGFVNNFAGGGSSLSAGDPINGPLLNSGIWAYILPFAAVALVIVAIRIWKHH